MIRIETLTLPHGIYQLSCELPKHRLIGVLGANGAGKSSLLKAIAGIIKPVSGRIVIDGCDNQTLSYTARSELIAYLAQNTPVHWALTTDEVIALGAHRPLSSDIVDDNIQSVAKRCDVTQLLKRPFDTLSGGERARVHLARCLMKDAPILLADEPIAALDPYYQIDIMQHLQRLSTHMTCVVVLHQLSLAYRFCQEIVLLKQGKLVAAGRTDDVIIAENLATAFRISAKIDACHRHITAIEQLNIK